MISDQFLANSELIELIVNEKIGKCLEYFDILLGGGGEKMVSKN